MIKKNLKLKKLKKSYPSLNPGDCLVHHSLAVHGSNKNHSNNSRKGITFQFVNFHSKIDIIRKTKYERSLKKQIQSRVY
jgi:ectoine hydroxylase-related dioxygenase (phytanoyl-CoA dioxygenase family)